MIFPVSSLLIAAAFAFQPAPDGSYADPRGAFHLSLPAGWTTSRSTGEGTVKLVRGSADCVVTYLKGSASGQDMVSQVIGQFANQWQNFNIVDQGIASFAGQQGYFTAALGSNAKNIPSVLRISAVGSGTQVLVLIMSVPQSDYNSLKADLVKIEQSLAFGGIAAGQTSPPVVAASPERLAALDAAYRAGVLTREEYEAKKNALQREGGVPAVTASRPGVQGTMRLARLGIRDPGINNIEAVSLLVPAGWKAEGRVQWYPDYSILANLLLRITDPQTGASIEFLPVQNFTWLTQSIMPMQPGANYLGNIVWQPIADMPQFIQVFYVPQALRHLQGAQIAARQDLPAVAAEIAQAMNGVSFVKSERVRYEYAEGAQTWEEDVYCSLTYLNHQMGTLWSVHSAHALRAPKGQLDRLTPLMEAAVNSLRISPDWYGGYMYVSKLFMDRMAQGIRNAGEISRIISQNNDEISRMFAESYRQKCESEERINRSFTEYIRGVDTYRNPYENRAIQLPSGYRDAWVSPAGEYILSNDASFNPNVGATTEWRRMQGP